MTIFLTTQYLDEADQLADRIALLDQGRLVAEGTPDELKRRIPGGHVAQGAAKRARRNTALHTDNIETGFFDDQGRPAPWPDDIDDWTPGIREPHSPEPGQPPF